MPSTTEAPASQKSAYQRPYKTRSQRREDARRKYDENADHKFLIRVAVTAGFLLVLAVGLAVKEWTGREAEASAQLEAVR